MGGSDAGLNRRQFLEVAAGAGLAAATTPAWPGLTFAGAKPKLANLLFVFADQRRAVSVGCYGDTQVRTPHMDALAKQGIRLETCLQSIAGRSKVEEEETDLEMAFGQAVWQVQRAIRFRRKRALAWSDFAYALDDAH